MADAPEIGIGDVEVKLGSGASEITLVLKPTPNAMKKLSNSPGGIPGLVERVLNYQWDTFELVVMIGANLTANQAKTHNLEQLLFDAGFTKLAPLLVRYLSNLSNGGRPIKDEAEEGDDPDPLAARASA